MSTFLSGLLNNDLTVILAGVLGGFLGLLLSYKLIGKMIRMIGTATGEISSFLSEERVEIAGKADAQTTIQSPITKTSCVLWQVAVAERRSSGKSSHWVTVFSDTSVASFDVYDGTGRVRVYPGRKMEIFLKDDVKKSSGVFYSLDEQTQTALSELGVNTKGLLGLNKSMRVQERYLQQGDQVYLLGRILSNREGKVMDTDSPLVVSDHSELRLLGKFAGQVFLNVLIGIVSGAALAFFFINR